MTSLSLFLSSFVVAALLLNTRTNAKQTGCSADPLIPDRPFVVVWNHPTSRCEDHGIHLDFHKWGIVDNERDRFFGQKIVLFYNLGKWPYYNNGKAVNSGLPQLADIDAHIAKVDDDLKRNVWNKTFTGFGVIDMEKWRPLFWLNFDSMKIYQDKSLALAKQRFPKYDDKKIAEEAQKEFETAAREIMERTLEEVKKLRPGGKWGYYLYPRTWWSSTVKDNDKMSWVYTNSTALYPSIYFSLNDPISTREKKINDTLHEALRVKAKYSPPTTPIMTYANCQNGPYKTFDEKALSYAILQPANMGASGVILWGSSHDADAKNECDTLKNYVENTLGPYSLKLTNFFGNCTQQLCNSHGRCVRKDYEKIYQTHMREYGRNECLISDEQLAYKTKPESDRPKQKITKFPNVGGNDRKNIKLFLFLKYFREFHTSRKHKFPSKYVHRMIITSNDGLEKPLNSWNFVDLMQKVNDESSKFSLTNPEGKPETENKEEIFERETNTDANTKHAHIISNSLIDFDTESPDYDFDDYVCKCYSGYSGSHCEKTE